MNFILNNKLAIFLIFTIFYCLFNYQLIEGLDGGRYIKNRETGEVRLATSKEIAVADSTVEKFMTTRELDEAVKSEKRWDQTKAMDKNAEDWKKELEKKELEKKKLVKNVVNEKGGAIKRLVENIDGEKGQAIEQAAADQMKSIVETGPTNQQGTDEIAAQSSDDVVAESLKHVKKLQTDAFERAKKHTEDAMAQSKIFNEKLFGTQGDATDQSKEEKENPYTLASQGENEIKGAGSDVAKLKKQRDSLARELSCEGRCKLLYETSFICNNGDCLCENGEDYKIHGKCDQFHLNPGEA